MAEKPTSYYVPEQSPWPFITAVALFLVAFGAANFVQQHSVTGLVAVCRSRRLVRVDD